MAFDATHGACVPCAVPIARTDTQLDTTQLL